MGAPFGFTGKRPTTGLAPTFVPLPNLRRGLRPTPRLCTGPGMIPGRTATTWFRSTCRLFRSARVLISHSAILLGCFFRSEIFWFTNCCDVIFPPLRSRFRVPGPAYATLIRKVQDLGQNAIPTQSAADRGKLREREISLSSRGNLPDDLHNANPIRASTRLWQCARYVATCPVRGPVPRC